MTGVLLIKKFYCFLLTSLFVSLSIKRPLMSSLVINPADDVVAQVLVLSRHQTGETGLDREAESSPAGPSHMEPSIEASTQPAV